jgi:hypothetical protein
MEMEVTDYTRPNRLGSTTRMSTAEIRGAVTFEPDPAGTRMRWSWELQPKGVFKLMGSSHRSHGQAAGGGDLGWSQAVHGEHGTTHHRELTPTKGFMMNGPARGAVVRQPVHDQARPL